ncbi:MAG: bifunctional phosphoribosylaminoimidazolecarboxamide formyltransferase/IMP cyclohydrolase [Phycisphaerales bacterium]|nr:bifunctional phosphoribosylaminoimidazolecarboxamide formyltransferase/IMP cyclohydrolase [Phycisphaerales bacterium]
MSHLVPVRRALISVSDKTDIVAFARVLVEHGVEIVSTGGTAVALTAAGIAVRSIDQFTGFPEMLDGRVKTLHPKVHGGLLGRRQIDSHLEAMRAHGIEMIDLVCVNLYPFERTVREDGVAEEHAIEQIDIGGPSMLRSAAKNFESVLVVTNPSQYDRVASELKTQDGSTSLALRREFAALTFARTAEYDTTIAAWMARRMLGHERFPPVLRQGFTRHLDLRYGENPHQLAAAYSDPTASGPSVLNADLLHGKPLSYNNLLDAAAALELVQDLSETFPTSAAAAILKHTNPCGCAVAGSLLEAFDRAYAGDTLAAYGGILACNRVIDAATAASIAAGEKFLEVIVAEGYTPEALAILSQRWKLVRLLAVGAIKSAAGRPTAWRSIPGGMLVQDQDRLPVSLDGFQHAAGPAPDRAALADAAMLTIVVKHLKSNAVCIGRAGELWGAGAGQMDRVASCRIAVEKASARMQHSDGQIVAAGDAFFPFADGPKLLIDAGVRCIVHPGGSKRDQETFDLCNQHAVTCLTTGTRRFRH